MNALQADIAPIGQHVTGLEDNHLATRALKEMGKSPRQSASRVGDEGIDGAYERILLTIDVVLVGLTAVTRRGLVELGDRHGTDVSVSGNTAVASLVIEPVAADDADGAGRLFYVVDALGTGLHGRHVGIGDGLSAENRVFNIVYGTRLLIVEYHGNLSLFGSGIDVAPLFDFTVEDTPYVGNGDAGVGVLLVLDERQSVEG